MSPASLSWPLAVIVLAVLAGMAGTLRRPGLSAARKGLLCALQLLAGLALWLVLQPPLQPQPALHGHLLTSPGARLPEDARGPVYALPEAGPVAGAVGVPDLASLLRSQPRLTAVQLHGDGLPARDRIPQRAALAHQAAPPQGLVEVQLPGTVAAGGSLEVRLRLAGADRGHWQVELLDPAGRMVDRQAPAADGRASLQAPLRGAGQMVYRLRVVDAGNRLVDQAPLPVHVQEGSALRLHQLAGAPNAENKFLQRWAADAGLAATRQLPTGGGVVLGDPQAGVDAATLARTDLLLLDERSLLALGSSGRARVRAALRAGLGVLVQPLDALQASHRQALAELGLRVQGGSRRQALRLETEKATPERLDLLRGPRPHTPAQPEAAPALERWQLDAGDALPLRAAGQPLGLWQAVGRGRIGLLAVPDTHLLVLAGRGDLHATLWADAAGTLARARERKERALQLPARIWQHERSTVCGLEGDTEARHTDSGQSWHLRIDPATPGCAAWWPEQAGWHRIGNQPVYVTAPDQAPGLHRAHTRRETAGIVAASALPADHALPQQPGPRWPWWLALVGLLGAVWWMERQTERAAP